MEHCIVYFSVSVDLFQESDLVTLLQQSRHDNVVAGISSILLIKQGSIVQVVESNRKAIEALHNRIEQDHRHSHVINIVDVSIEERSFVGTWAVKPYLVINWKSLKR